MNWKPALVGPAAAIALLVSLSGCTTPKPHDFSKWEREVAAFEREAQANPPPANAVLFLGSSSIRMWDGLQSDFPDYPVIQRGVGGCEIVDLTHFADRIVFPYKPSVIVFRCGGNDLARGKTPREVFVDFKRFAETVHKRLPETTIVFTSWSPTIARWENAEREAEFNAQVRDYARKRSYIEYLETSDFILGPDGRPRADLLGPDRLHLSRAGYRELTAQIRPALDALVRERMASRN
jgi:hypothetical protein